jgi:putative nucleotidyltransferase with HDIG domain
MSVERPPSGAPLPLLGYVTAVIATGLAVIVHSALAVPAAAWSLYAIALAAVTIVSGRFTIKVPGRSVTVSVSEVFLFVSIMLFGPAIPTLTVALDGLLASLTQQNRRLYRALFNIAEPAISTWTAAWVFFAIAGLPRAPWAVNPPIGIFATVAMAAAFFVLNSGLSAVAVAIERGVSPVAFWRGHAWYLAVNYYAAASIATLVVSTGSHVNLAVVGLIAPLLLLSYVAYRESAIRAEEAGRHVQDVERLYRASVEMLAIAVDAKDQVTHGHIRRVQHHTQAVAAALGVTDARELKAIEAGALLHDIGKLAVPDYILNKPSALTPAEFEIIKRHPSMGARILTAVEFPYPIVPIVRHHHEQWDGRGYPDGLVGSEIPLGARILAVVDCFDALTSDRPYRPRLSDDQAIAILRSRKGTFYDPSVVEKMIELIPDLRREDHGGSAAGDLRSCLVAGLSRTHGREALESGLALPSPTHQGLAPEIDDLIDERVAAIGASACLFRIGAGDVLTPVYATPRLRAIAPRLRPAIGGGVSGWVAANRSTIRRADPALEAPELAEVFAMTSCASVPVFARADLYGVLTAYWTGPRRQDGDVDALGVLAQEIGLLISRGPSVLPTARPFESTQAFPVATVS